MVSMKDDYHWPGDGMEASQKTQDETQDEAMEGST